MFKKIICRLGFETKLLTVGVGLLLPACGGIAAGTNSLGLIPIPQTIERSDGNFALASHIQIYTDTEARDSADYLAIRLRNVAGCDAQVIPLTANKVDAGNIVLAVDHSKTNLADEGYELTVTPQEIKIQAATPAGAFYGVQTLLQLLPPDIFSTGRVSGVAWTVPCVRIEDTPRFKWRGFMLDVSRHFYNKEQVEQTLDFMAWHKLNVFHWHLVDDHGWRIEIKKYPKLTQVGAWRNSIGFELASNESTAYGPDGHYGGYYTQDDVREIVAYAQARHILVVPEIEMPGHSTAALTAYPELSCTGGPFNMDLDAGIFNGIYCPGNPQTFTFLEDVLTEIFQLFPSPYIHIGGDEVPKDNWHNCPKCQALMKAEGLKDEEALQSYFIRHIEKFVTAHGRKLIGWSEIEQGGLPPNATVMDWNGGGAEAANSGHDVVMASQEYTYVCYYQSLDRPPQLKARRRYLPLDKAYSFNPILTTLTPGAEAHILGVEDCLWTVFFASMQQAEEMSFPRLCALAEIAWSPASALNYGSFTNRLQVQERRLDAAGVTYWNDRAVKLGGWKSAQIKAATNTIEWSVPLEILAAGKYRLSLNYLQGKNGLKISSAELLQDGQPVVSDVHEGFAGAGYNRPEKAPANWTLLARDWNYFLDLKSVKPGANYAVRVTVAGNGGTDSSGVVFLEPPALNHE